MSTGRILTLDATLTTLRVAVVDDGDALLETKDIAHRVGIDDALALVHPLVVRFAPDAMVHRLTRGAASFPEPVVVDGAMLERLCLMTGLDPLRIPAAVNLLASVRARYPLIPQIVCFADDGRDVRLAPAGRSLLAQRARAPLAPPRPSAARIRRWIGTGHPPR